MATDDQTLGEEIIEGLTDHLATDKPLGEKFSVTTATLPKPPEGYAMWLDYLVRGICLDHAPHTPHTGPAWAAGVMGPEIQNAARAELKALRSLAGIGAAHCVDVVDVDEYGGATVTCTFTCPKCGETTTTTEGGRAGDTDGATTAPAPAADGVTQDCDEH